MRALQPASGGTGFGVADHWEMVGEPSLLRDLPRGEYGITGAPPSRLVAIWLSLGLPD